MYQFKYSFYYSAVKGILDDALSRTLLLKYAPDVKFVRTKYNSMIDYAYSSKPYSHPNYISSIGTKPIFDNMQGDMVRDRDTVWTVSHIFHENQHMYQQRILYQDASLLHDDVLTMARMDAIASVFHGYYDDLYWYLPHELDANYRAMQDTVSYFDTYVVNSQNQPIIDVRTELVKCAEEHRSYWFGSGVPHTFEGMLWSLEDLKIKHHTMPRNVLFNLNYSTDRRVYDIVSQYPFWQDVINAKPSERIGVAYDEKLLAMSLDAGVSFGNVHAGFRGEEARVRKLYPSQKNFGLQAVDKFFSVLERLDKNSTDDFEY